VDQYIFPHLTCRLHICTISSPFDISNRTSPGSSYGNNQMRISVPLAPATFSSVGYVNPKLMQVLLKYPGSEDAHMAI
jgi:hypothetical protein